MHNLHAELGLQRTKNTGSMIWAAKPLEFHVQSREHEVFPGTVLTHFQSIAAAPRGKDSAGGYWLLAIAGVCNGFITETLFPASQVGTFMDITGFFLDMFGIIAQTILNILKPLSKS